MVFGWTFGTDGDDIASQSASFITSHIKVASKHQKNSTELDGSCAKAANPSTRSSACRYDPKTSIISSLVIISIGDQFVNGMFCDDLLVVISAGRYSGHFAFALSFKLFVGGLPRPTIYYIILSVGRSIYLWLPLVNVYLTKV